MGNSLIWWQLWKSNAGTAFFGLWQRKGLKVWSMGCITKAGWVSAQIRLSGIWFLILQRVRKISYI